MGSCRLLFFLLLSLLPAVFSDLAANTAALLRLRDAVRGRTLRWSTSSPNPCLWEGIKCDSANSSVIELRLPGDGLSGQIPLNTIGNLTELRALSLRRNSLSGPLPSDLYSCTELLKLHLDGNKFSGEIPVSFNKLTKLRVLRLEENQFNGTLADLGSLVHLRDFNVSFNRLTGPIPVSYKRLSNESSYVGNSLCGGPLDSCPNDGGDEDKLSAGAIAGIAIGAVTGALLVILVVLMMLWRKRRGTRISAQVPMSPVKPYPIMETDNREIDNGLSDRGVERRVVKKDGNEGIVFFEENNENFSLEELLKASAEVLGKGSAGTTYRAYLDGGGEVIVKRLKSVGFCERKFREKIEVLGGYRHENLVRLLGYFYGTHERLVVYDPMPISLCEALQGIGNRGGYRKPLTWADRAKIAKTIARGIEYLHSLGPKVAHGNLHSSNILLTNSNHARLSDFGLLQLLSPTLPSKIIGYCAPEIAGTQKASQKADVYSFGVVLLQLLTGKDPNQAINEEGIELPRWVQSVGEDRWMIEVFDPEIMLQHQSSGDQIIQLLHLAISCTAQHPNTRPSMLQVTHRIQHILNT